MTDTQAGLVDRLRGEVAYGRHPSASMDASRWANVAENAANEIERLSKAGRNLLPYLRWTIGAESPGHHPTMPSAVAAFESIFSKQEGKCEWGSNVGEAHQPRCQWAARDGHHLWVPGIGRTDGPPLPTGEVNLKTGERRTYNPMHPSKYHMSHAGPAELAQLRDRHGFSEQEGK